MTDNPDGTFTVSAKCGNDKFKATADSQILAIRVLAVEVGLQPSAAMDLISSLLRT